MSTSSAPRVDKSGATSDATTLGTSAPVFEVLNSPNGPIFLSTVLRVVQAHSAWSQVLSKGSPPTCGVRRIGQVVRLLDAHAEVRLTRVFGLGTVRQRRYRQERSVEVTVRE